MPQGVVSLFAASPWDGEPVAAFESPGLAAVPCGVPPGGGAFLMTLNASGVSLSDTGPPGGGAFSITLNAGGRGLSEATGPPGGVAFSWALNASGRGDCAGAEPGVWVGASPGAGWGTVLGGRRTVAGGVVGVVGLLLTAGAVAGRVVDPGGVATRGG